jgi:hypothetical protein
MFSAIDPVALKPLQRLQGGQDVAGEPVELADEHHVEHALFGVAEHLNETRALGDDVGPGAPPLVGELVHCDPPMRRAVERGRAALGIE